MKGQFRIVLAMLRKDVLSLWLIGLLTSMLVILGVVFDNYQPATPISGLLELCIWFATALLATSVIQQDTAVSARHDWLIRPISRTQLIIAKGLFIVATIFFPVFVARWVIYALKGQSLGEAALAAANVSSLTLILCFPFVIAAAVITPTVLQAALALGACFVAIFILMTFTVQLGYSLDETVMQSGSGWIVIYSLGLTFIVMMMVVLWLQYGRRKTGLARTVFGVVACMPLVGGVLASTKSVMAVQQVLTPQSPPPDFALRLNRGCFFAESMDVAAANTGDARLHSRFMGRGLWSDGELARLGHGAVAFSTAFSTLGVPKGWRLRVVHAAATYHDAKGNELEQPVSSYQSARSEVGFDGGSLSTNYWLLSRAVAERLAKDSSAQLTIDYTLSLLAPQTVMLEVDGGWHHLPHVGYCNARRDESTSKVSIDCFKRGVQPGVISAKFIGTLNSVESGPSSYKPRWLMPLTGQRYQFAMPVPVGADPSRVMLTAYELQAHFDRRVVSTGVLGGTATQCALPPVDPLPLIQAQSPWRDSSPHQTIFVGVDGGARLEVLDWGGSGRALVLLAGLGDSAHIFDEIAPKLAQRYHVYGISRRGHGASTVAEAGYTVPQLSADIVRVLDTLHLEAPVVAGSSIAGEELNELGAKHSGRIAGLVYLDAAADRTLEMPQEQRAVQWLLPAPPRPEAHELNSYAGIVAYMNRIGEIRYPEGEIVSSFAVGPDGRLADRRMDPRVPRAIMDAVQTPDYKTIRIPALALYAMPRNVDDLWRPWYDRSNTVVQQAVARQYEFTVRGRRAMELAFEQGVANGRVVEIGGAKHHLWISNETQVIAELDAFVARLPRIREGKIDEARPIKLSASTR